MVVRGVDQLTRRVRRILTAPDVRVSVAGAHAAMAWVVVASNGLVGLWALGAHRLEALRRPVLWWSTGVAEATILVQVVLGVVMVARDDREVPQFHMFYGFVALAAVGVIYSYRQQLASRVYLLYGFGGLFLMGMALRATFIGGAR